MESEMNSKALLKVTLEDVQKINLLKVPEEGENIYT